MAEYQERSKVRVGELDELIAKLEAAEGPSRVLDFELHILLIEDELWPGRDLHGQMINPTSRMSDYLRTYRDVIDADDQDFEFGRYTASIDAAVALAERVLPAGWTRAVDATAPEAGIDVEYFEPTPPDLEPGAEYLHRRVRGCHDHEPIATVIAILRALKSITAQPRKTEGG